MELGALLRCLALMLLLPLLLAATPAPTLHLVHAWVREPASLKVIGGVGGVPITLGAWRSPTEAEFSHRGSLFDLDAVLDTRDPSTTVEVRVATETQLTTKEGWLIAARPAAKLGLLSGDANHWLVGFHRELQMPVPAAELAFTDAKPLPALQTTKFDCVVSLVHASATATAPTWSPASYMWTFSKAGSTKDAWLHVRAESPEGLVVHGWVQPNDYACNTGSGGGFGLRGIGGSSSDGFLEAREVTLLAQTALFTAADAKTKVATLHGSATALLLDDGSVRVKVSNKTQDLSLHGVFLGPNAKYLSAPKKKRTHGTGSSSSRNDSSPHVCADAGVAITPCYGSD